MVVGPAGKSALPFPPPLIPYRPFAARLPACPPPCLPACRARTSPPGGSTRSRPTSSRSASPTSRRACESRAWPRSLGTSGSGQRRRCPATSPAPCTASSNNSDSMLLSERIAAGLARSAPAHPSTVLLKFVSHVCCCCSAPLCSCRSLLLFALPFLPSCSLLDKPPLPHCKGPQHQIILSCLTSSEKGRQAGGPGGRRQAVQPAAMHVLNA